jgi:hypothetical protein
VVNLAVVETGKDGWTGIHIFQEVLYGYKHIGLIAGGSGHVGLLEQVDQDLSRAWLGASAQGATRWRSRCHGEGLLSVVAAIAWIGTLACFYGLLVVLFA